VSTGRDPRRRPTADERRAAYVRANGQCQNCGTELGPDYHNAHMAAWINGGPSAGENIEAWCADCNLRLGPQDAEQVQGLHFRQWQAEAFPIILRQLHRNGVATLHAAPGAGKTFFAVATYKKLREAGLADRVVVVVPNTVILDQWKDAFGALRIHLDTEPRDGVIEHPDTEGCVITYQRLAQPGTARAHALRIGKHPTVVIFDEVHHLADKQAWGNAAAIIAGDVTNGTIHAAAVLNMTGTLFRSSRTKRISTVKYDRVSTDEGEKLQAVADWSIKTADLIGTELRPVDLYSYSSQAQLVDLRNEEVISSQVADLDKQQAAAVFRGQLGEKGWLAGFATEALRMLDNQLAFVEEPLKLLFIADSIPAARKAADAINKIAGRDFARLVTSDTPSSRADLKAAAKEKQPCAIVAVQMVTEGFDCPQVSTIAYATNITADLFVAQMMARAMRVTSFERATGKMLPAQILIPDHSVMRRVFAAALKDVPRLIPDTAEGDGCGRCGADGGQCGCRSAAGAPAMRRYQLLDLSDPRLDSATVLGHDDGHVPADELNWAIGACRQLTVPEVYAPRFAVGSRRRPVFRKYVRAEGPDAQPAPTMTVTETDPRSVNRAFRARMSSAAGWMRHHIGHDTRFEDITHFQAKANGAARPKIRRGGRDMATSEQLRMAAEWMGAEIARHCDEHGCRRPGWLNGGDDE
jgi:superfamily II DNA or RNA helicase